MGDVWNLVTVARVVSVMSGLMRGEIAVHEVGAVFLSTRTGTENSILQSSFISSLLEGFRVMGRT